MTAATQSDNTQWELSLSSPQHGKMIAIVKG